MNRIFIIFLSLSVAGTLMIAILLLLKPLYKKHLSKGLQYYIWLIVIARLIIPYAPEVNFTGSLFTGIEDNVIRPVTDAYWGTDQQSLTADMEGNNADLNKGTDQKEDLSEQPAFWQPGIWMIWVIAAIGLFIRKITVYQSFVRYIRAGCEEVTDMELLERFGSIVESQNIRGNVLLRTNKLISTPLLIGFMKPCIILPEAEIPAMDFQYTILHELKHYKRMDMFYKWIVQFTICLHWFNPFVYLAGREINRACELSCDEAVITGFGKSERQTYGDTLLNSVKVGGRYRNSVASVTLYESKELLGERLEAIMERKKISGTIKIISVLFAAVILLGAIFAGAYTVRKNSNDHAAGGITSAPDNIPVITARAESVTPADRPDVTITIDKGAAVNLVPTSENEITVDYGSTLYDVSVTNINGEWDIKISYEGNYSKYPSATLYIPSISYGEVSIDANDATVRFNSVFKNIKQINAAFDSSSVFYTIPAGFEGKLEVSAPESYLELRSDDGYKNCDVAIINCTSFGEVGDRFVKQNNSLTYTVEKQTGEVRMDFKGSGYVIAE